MEQKGMYDVPAIVSKIKEVTGVEKVTYSGYSQGSTIMFYGLASQVEEEFFADNVNAFIGIAPCVILPFWKGNNKRKARREWLATDWLVDDEFPLLLGENFDHDRYCEIASPGMCDELKYEMWFGSGSIDTRSYNQYFMNSYANRLQAYAENFDDPTKTETELYDISEIDKVPVYVINAEFDGDCETPADFLTMMKDVPSFKDQTVLAD